MSIEGEVLKQNLDIAWQYFDCPDPKDKNTTKCKFCNKVSKGGIYRGKQHLVGGFRNVTVCKKCPDVVREEIRDYMIKKKEEKEGRNLATGPDDYVSGFGDEYDDDMFGSSGSFSHKRPMASGNSSSTGATVPFKKPKQKGPLDVYYSQSPHQSETGGRSRQTKLGENDASKKVFRDRACKCFARWMYDAGIPFNAVKHDSFQVFIEAVGQHGPGMKAPSYHEVRVPLLKQEVENTRKSMKAHEEEWVTHGCSILSDGWKDRRERTLINFLINSPKGSMFIESVDASAYAKTGEKMFELFSKVVDKVGPSNVVQVVTDSASNNVLAGKLLEAKYPNLFWTPCAAHCLDLILEDIFKIPNMKQTFERAISVHSYIYGRTGLVNMMRQFTKMKELLRPAKTSTKEVHEEVTSGLLLCIERLVPDVLTRCKIDDELVKYKRAEGLFGSAMAIRRRTEKAPEEDGLTWNVVATAAGVGEPSYRTRQSVRGGSSSRAPQSSLRLIDEEDSEEECEVEDEGERLQQDEAQFDRTIEEDYDLVFDEL
ncbi:hypothetical protein EZV62_024497 [Acer yangbiense]|uniref:BED-type domain-containing protein n=1 Tax=Acer yangbiense TaxID=1000413 RepID=A0A5C7GWB8_9ROSI|nr:hypothetical protein EZV62_024497 [Acer yangbiense]